MNVRLFGDSTIAGLGSGQETFVTVVGDVTIDLTATPLPATLRIRTFQVVGDVTVRVPAGTAVELSGVTLFGDRKVERFGDAGATAGQVPAALRLSAYSLAGDVRVVAEGQPAVPGSDAEGEAFSG